MLTGIIIQDNTVILSTEQSNQKEVYYDCTIKSYGPDHNYWAVYYL